MLLEDFLKYMKYGIIASAFIVFAFYGCQKFNKKFNLRNDNIIEQFVESLIESETGIQIDLTPGD